MFCAIKQYANKSFLLTKSEEAETIQRWYIGLNKSVEMKGNDVTDSALSDRTIVIAKHIFFRSILNAWNMSLYVLIIYLFIV